MNSRVPGKETTSKGRCFFGVIPTLIPRISPSDRKREQMGDGLKRFFFRAIHAPRSKGPNNPETLKPYLREAVVSWIFGGPFS